MSEEVHQHQWTLPADGTEIILIRHGASEPAAEGRAFPTVDGRADPRLAEAGHAQASAIADSLASEPIVALYVSSLQRTHETAAPLAERLGVTPIVLPELSEVHLGDFDGGQYRVRVAANDPIIMQVFEEERWDAIPNAETMDDLARRVRAGIERIVAEVGPGVSAAAVAHGGVIGELARQATGSRPFAFVHSDNGSITRLVVFQDGRWLLRSFNDTVHMRDLARSTETKGVAGP